MSERPPVTCARSNSYCGRRNRPTAPPAPPARAGSFFGTKRTSRPGLAMSVHRGRADSPRTALDILLRSADVLAPACDHFEEFTIAHRLDRIFQRRCEGRSLGIGTVADVALRMVTAVPGIGIPVDGAIGRDLERCIAVLVQILAVLGFDCSRINGVFGESEPSRCHEGYRGSYKPDCAQELVLDASADMPTRREVPRDGTIDRVTAAARTP
jgi:hypothetical protein